MRVLLSLLSLFVLFWYLSGSFWVPIALLAGGLLIFLAFAATALQQTSAAQPELPKPKFQAPDPLDDTIRITVTVRIRELSSEEEDAPPDRSQPHGRTRDGHL
jgi:acyl dehydratase